MLKVRIIILNWNGREILPPCLASIVEATGRSPHPTKITLLDNQSSDGSPEWVRQNFPAVHVVISPRNCYLVSFNDCVRQVEEDIVILLNNDIRVDPLFVAPLVRVFEQNPDAFLASPQVFSFDGNQLEGGRTRTEIRWGMFVAEGRFLGYENLKDTPGHTFSSGFGAFHRKRFLKLGGYDDLYLPGVIEDTDLGFRAWREGYRSYYVPESRIYHIGQASFRKAFGPKKIMILAHRNTLLFMWKNLRDPPLLAEHFLFLIPRLLYSLLQGRDELLIGFLQALPRIPQAIRRRISYPKRARSDREIFRLSNEQILRRRYLFKKRWKRVAVGIFDAVGFFVMGPLRLFRKRPPLNPQRILVIRRDSLGDGALTLPALQSLRDRFPKAAFDFWVTPSIQELYQCFFQEARFCLFEGPWMRIVQKIRRGHYDLGIDFRGDVRNILLMALAGIPHRWGRGGTGGGFLLTHQIRNPHQKHEALEYLELVGASSLPTHQRALASEAVSCAEIAPSASGLLAMTTGKKIVIHIGAGYPSKRWSTGNYVKLAQRIQQENLGTPIYIGTPQDKTLLDPFRAELQNGVIDLMGETSLQQLLCILKEADLFIGNDSGPAHLAALLGIKRVIVFSGTNDFRKWAPWPSQENKIVVNPVPCSPCEERICPLKRQVCLEDISVEEVFCATKEMLGN